MDSVGFGFGLGSDSVGFGYRGSRLLCHAMLLSDAILHFNSTTCAIRKNDMYHVKIQRGDLNCVVTCWLHYGTVNLTDLVKRKGGMYHAKIQRGAGD